MKIIYIFILTIIILLNLENFLDTTTAPIKSDAIFCLGGAGVERITTAVSLFRNNYSTHHNLYSSGVQKELLTKLKKFNKNIDLSNVTHVENMKNTMDEVLYIDTLMEKENYSSIIIVTDPPHSRRVKFMIEQFSNNLRGKYIIVSSNPKWWKNEYYFLNSKAILFSVKEFGKLFYNYFKYSFLFTFDDNFIKNSKGLNKIV